MLSVPLTKTFPSFHSCASVLNGKWANAGLLVAFRQTIQVDLVIAHITHLGMLDQFFDGSMPKMFYPDLSHNSWIMGKQISVI